MKSFSVLILSIIFFAAFSFHYEMPLIDFKIGENDLSKLDVGNWLLYEIMIGIFIIFIGLVGLDSKNKFIRRFFAAIVVEGFVSIVRHCIFGYYEPFYMAAVANAIPMSYILYSYFVYVNRTE